MGAQKAKTIEAFKWLLRRRAVLYLALALACYWSVDLYNMKVKTINHVVPDSMEKLVAFALGPSQTDTAVLQKYFPYYKTATKIVPHSSADWSLLGYCYFYMGDLARSELCYKKAIKLMPNFFWFHYNLAAVHLHQGEAEKSAAVLGRALEVSPQATLYFMQAAKAFILLLPYANQMGYSVEGGLIQGYRNAQAMRQILQQGASDQDRKQFLPRIF